MDGYLFDRMFPWHNFRVKAWSARVPEESLYNYHNQVSIQHLKKV